jgi:hypothetical protein
MVIYHVVRESEDWRTGLLAGTAVYDSVFTTPLRLIQAKSSQELGKKRLWPDQAEMSWSEVELSTIGSPNGRNSELFQPLIPWDNRHDSCWIS